MLSGRVGRRGAISCTTAGRRSAGASVGQRLDLALEAGCDSAVRSRMTQRGVTEIPTCRASMLREPAEPNDPSSSGNARPIKVGPRKLIAIAALVSGGTILDAARKAGVHERTLRRWAEDPAFLRMLDETSRAVIHEVVATLQLQALAAVETLRLIHLDPRETTHNRITAARTIVEHAVRCSTADIG